MFKFYAYMHKNDRVNMLENSKFRFEKIIMKKKEQNNLEFIYLETVFGQLMLSIQQKGSIFITSYFMYLTIFVKFLFFK